NLHSSLAHLRQSGIQEEDSQQLAVSTLATQGSGHYFKPHNPVIVIACQKEENQG
ncbi:cobalt-precorrin-6Y C(15)-methyltransferase, partial [Klebsiella pneumoniae]|nr:cobalt-precorrin-6Y C(15)-methyltransferase [Klebsiella pneumoniae]